MYSQNIIQWSIEHIVYTDLRATHTNKVELLKLTFQHYTAWQPEECQPQPSDACNGDLVWCPSQFLRAPFLLLHLDHRKSCSNLLCIFKYHPIMCTYCSNTCTSMLHYFVLAHDSTYQSSKYGHHGNYIVKTLIKNYSVDIRLHSILHIQYLLLIAFLNCWRMLSTCIM